MDNLPSGRPGTAPEIGGESGSKTIHNDILDSPRTGSALKVDDVKPIYEINEKTGKSQIIKEFPATAQARGFNDLVDNYAGYATKTTLNDATLYQLEGSLNGVEGRFEWIIQDGKVTHRMFIQNGAMNPSLSLIVTNVGVCVMKKNNFDRKQVFILILSPILSLISFVLVYYLDPLNYGEHVSLTAIPAFLLSIIILVIGQIITI